MRNTFLRLAVGLLLAATALQPQMARAADFKLVTDPKKTCSAIKLSGDFVPGDYDRFASILKKATAIAPLRRLYLNSRGGQIFAALAITDLVHNTAPTVETIVQSRQICTSACVIVLTVGSQKYVSRHATVMIHRAFDERTKKSDADSTTKMGEYMVSYGMPPGVIQTMSNLRPKEKIAITPSNAKRLGFGSFKFYSSTNPPATPRCSWAGF